MMHELIDRENPRCLYCDNDCDVNFNGEYIAGSSIQYNVDILICQKCKEVFEIHSEQQSVEDQTEYLGFSFTCKQYYVYYAYKSGEFHLGKNTESFTAIKNPINFIWWRVAHSTVLPWFEVSFSDKEKLYNKLKTYILFS